MFVCFGATVTTLLVLSSSSSSSTSSPASSASSPSSSSSWTSPRNSPPSSSLKKAFEGWGGGKGAKKCKKCKKRELAPFPLQSIRGGKRHHGRNAIYTTCFASLLTPALPVLLLASCYPIESSQELGEECEYSLLPKKKKGRRGKQKGQKKTQRKPPPPPDVESVAFVSVRTIRIVLLPAIKLDGPQQVLVERGVLEKEGDGFSVVCATACLGELCLMEKKVGSQRVLTKEREKKKRDKRTKATHRGANVDGLDTAALSLLPLVGDSVGDNELLELRVVEGLDGVAAEDAVGDNGDGGFGAVGHDDVGGLAQGAACVGHVVYNDGNLVRDIAYEDHAGDFVRAGALLVDEGESEV